MHKITLYQKNLIRTIVGWSLLAVVLLVLTPMLYPVSLPVQYYFYHLILLCVLIAIYYFNVYYLLPLVLYKKKVGSYIIALIIVCAAAIFTMNAIEQQLQLGQLIHKQLYPNSPHASQKKNYYIDSYLFILASIVLFIGFANNLLNRWSREEKKNIILQEQKSRAELNTLKAQINPHFFFNTLNTIYALTHSDIEKSQGAILKLSKMMRYVMHEDNAEHIKISEEIAFINNYLALMQYRLPESVILSVSITHQHPNTLIAPMVLLTFIENCFKHGITTEKPCAISINAYFEDRYFVLKTENTFLGKRKSEGIGIENTLKRLDILYPNGYTYKSETQASQYHCTLKIKLL